MGRKCVCNNCPNVENDSSKSRGITFHRFPIKNAKLLQCWLDAVNSNGFIPNSSSVICSKHFCDKDLYTVGIRRRLCPHAVPIRTGTTGVPDRLYCDEDLSVSDVDFYSEHDAVSSVDDLSAVYTGFEPDAVSSVEDLSASCIGFEPDVVCDVDDLSASCTGFEPDVVCDVDELSASWTGFEPDTVCSVDDLSSSCTGFEPDVVCDVDDLSAVKIQPPEPCASVSRHVESNIKKLNNDADEVPDILYCDQNFGVMDIDYYTELEPNEVYNVGEVSAAEVRSSGPFVNVSCHTDCGEQESINANCHKTEHAYSRLSSPRLCSQLCQCAETPTKVDLRLQIKRLEAKLCIKNKKIKAMSERVRRKRIKIDSMDELLKQLQKQYELDETAMSVLTSNFNNFPIELIRHEKQNGLTNKFRRRYSQTIREFAMTLYYYSPRAYDYVRTLLCLPHAVTLRNWSTSVNCDPGFFRDVLERLKVEADSDQRMKDCALMMDGIHIRKQTIFDSTTQSYAGFVDLGGLIAVETDKIAGEALVFMIVGLTGKWKCPIGYVLIDGLSGTLLAQLVKTALELTAEAGLKCVTITCDGTAANLDCLKKLGCKIGKNIDDISSSFPHPSIPNELVHSVLDPCHMLKLARNCLGALGSLASPSGVIQWKYIAQLIHLQQVEGLNIANKVTSKHLNWEKMKMNVSVAGQTLSSSVGDAISFLRDVMHLTEFQGSEATCEFIYIIDRLFDLTNSRNPFEKGYKAPMSLSNQHQWKRIIAESCQYLSSLTTADGTPLMEHARKTFVIGFIMTCQSLNAVADELLTRTESPYRYFLTYKVSQDHLELLFSCIRSRGGRNNNPNCLQLKYALRGILLHNRIRASKQSNCLLLDEIGHGSLFEIGARQTPVVQTDEDELSRKAQLESDVIADLISHYDDTSLSDIKQNILFYIAGFVVRKLQAKIKCARCIEALTDRLVVPPNIDHTYSFTVEQSYGKLTAYINRGGLLLPSDGVYRVIECTERFFQLLVVRGDLQISCSDQLLQKLVHAVNVKLLMQPIFPSLQDDVSHNAEIATDDLHHTQLLKAIAASYARIRLMTYAKRYTREVILANKPSNRHVNLKMTLFSHT